MVKILQIIPRFTAGGAERLVLEYAQRMPDNGYEVVVASARGAGDLLSKISDQGAVIIGEEGGLIAFVKIFRRLKTFVKNWQPDIIHTHVFSADVVGWALKQSYHQIPWVSTQHNVARHHPWWRRWVLGRILPRADKVIAVSEKVGTDCRDYFCLNKKSVQIIPNSIELADWLAVSTTDLFTGATVRLATIGRLEKQKGHSVLLRSLGALKDADWQLDIFGDGSLRQSLEHQAKQLGLERRIAWHGVVIDLPKRLENVDAVVQPSLWEGRSLVVMEALTAGRAVIASRPAAEGLIENKKTGLVVPAGDAEALTQALAYAINNRSEMKLVGARAREWARESFNIDKHVQRLQELYQEVIGDKL